MSRVLTITTSILCFCSPGFLARAGSEAADAIPGRVEKTLQDKGTGAPIIHSVEASFDSLFSDDIELTSSTIGYRIQRGGTRLKLDYTHKTIFEDYQINRQYDFLGNNEHIHRDYNGVNLELKQKLATRLDWTGTLGAYRGFTEYRSAWIANYYKQQYNPYGFRISGYADPDPKGVSGSSTFRWEYLPALGFFSAGASYSRDQIAPGYEADPFTGDALRERQVLETYSPLLEFENVLTPRVRVLNDFQLTRTSGRRPRYAYRGGLNIAVSESWTARINGGYTLENPSLVAHYASGTVEYELVPGWFINGTGGYYADTGEIENSLQISTAPPGVRVYRAGGGLRYTGRTFNFSLSAAPVWATYDSISLGTQPFASLYKNRNWISVQAAISAHF